MLSVGSSERCGCATAWLWLVRLYVHLTTDNATRPNLSVRHPTRCAGHLVLTTPRSGHGGQFSIATINDEIRSIRADDLCNHRT
jgi:hypothetical protein